MQKEGTPASPWRDWFRDVVKSASSSALSGGNDPRIHAADKPGTKDEHSASVTPCIPLTLATHIASLALPIQQPPSLVDAIATMASLDFTKMTRHDLFHYRLKATKAREVPSVHNNYLQRDTAITSLMRKRQRPWLSETKYPP
jgi:hypothetical protein